jgi:hypothetical protein
MSFKPEVYITSEGWIQNGLAFATREEAEQNARDLLMRWFVPNDSRVVESDDKPNYSYINHELVPLSD